MPDPDMVYIEDDLVFSRKDLESIIPWRGLPPKLRAVEEKYPYIHTFKEGKHSAGKRSKTKTKRRK